MLGFRKDKPGYNIWWGQRLSALCLAITGITLLILLYQDQPFAYGTAKIWFQSLWHYLLCLLFSQSLLIHFYIGTERIIDDYLQNTPIYKVAILLLKAGTWITAIGCIVILTILKGWVG